MSAIAGVVAIAVVGVVMVVVLGWVQAARTRRATRIGLARAEGEATDEQLLGLVNRAAPDDRVREVAGEVHPSADLEANLDRMRAGDHPES